MVEIKGQQIVSCTVCGSNKVKAKLGKGGIVGAGFLGISIGMWIPIIGWFLMMPVGLVMVIGGLLAMLKKTTHRNFKCEDCKHQFPIEIEKFQAYKLATAPVK